MKKIILLFAMACSIIPAFVFGQYSNSTVNGPWIVISQNDLYIIFDGNGTVNEMGFQQDSLNPAGIYSITGPGAINATLNLTNGTTWITGNMVNDTTAMVYVDTTDGPYTMFRVSNPGALAGTWSGYVYDSTISQVAKNIQFTVNSNGVITSATGISLIAGKIFAGNGTFSGYITASDANCVYKYFQMYGHAGADSLYGAAKLGTQSDTGTNVCGHNGGVFFTRTVTGVETVNAGVDFAVYPNPFTEQIEVTVKNPGSNTEADLYDVLGRKVYSREFGSAQNINLHLATLSSGVYLLTLTSNSKTTTRRLVKN